MDMPIRYMYRYCITCLNLLCAGYDNGIDIPSHNSIATSYSEQGTERVQLQCYTMKTLTAQCR